SSPGCASPTPSWTGWSTTSTPPCASGISRSPSRSRRWASVPAASRSARTAEHGDRRARAGPRRGRAPATPAPPVREGGAKGGGAPSEKLGELDLVADEGDEPQRDEELDDHPGGIELESPHAELGARRIRVVVVVQALAAGEPGEQPDVRPAVGEERPPAPP